MQDTRIGQSLHRGVIIGKGNHYLQIYDNPQRFASSSYMDGFLDNRLTLAQAIDAIDNNELSDANLLTLEDILFKLPKVLELNQAFVRDYIADTPSWVVSTTEDGMPYVLGAGRIPDRRGNPHGPFVIGAVAFRGTHFITVDESVLVEYPEYEGAEMYFDNTSFDSYGLPMMEFSHDYRMQGLISVLSSDKFMPLVSRANVLAHPISGHRLDPKEMRFSLLTKTVMEYQIELQSQADIQEV